jgi:hypothetical protein
MPRLQRLIAATVLVALSSALAGCGGMGNFDPSDLLDWLDTKKKLPGDRKPVFPEGVPGLEQGVPKDLYKGARQIDDPNAKVASAPAAPPPEEPKSKRGAKSKGKPAPAAAAPAPAAAPAAAADPAAPVDEGGTDAAPPAPKQKKIVRKRTTAPPADAPAGQSTAPASATQQSAAPFPAPMPSGTFTR